MPGERDATDRRFMAAALRLSRKHLGLTATNPSVATLIVRDEGSGPRIVGSGVTALGGRPHAETEALAEAGALARGATAYVTLEPCAHHGRTPPCAEALVAAGVARVVGGASDPDERVSGRGYAILRQAGIEVVEGICRDQAVDVMRGYLTRLIKKRPEVTLKLAVSSDGMIGRPGLGQVAVTGEISRRMAHVMRAEADAILVGIGTALADDPELTCRLPGLEGRSPARIVLDTSARLPLVSKLIRSAREVPLMVAAAPMPIGRGWMHCRLPVSCCLARICSRIGSHCLNFWGICPNEASRRCWWKAGRRLRGLFWRKVWWIGSACSKGQVKSATAASPRRSVQRSCRPASLCCGQAGSARTCIENS
jgi:riboflavin biosynthesis protein RibD